uniref:Uncharacterized protein n=1 Tax=Nelumbo nucifera TaxID=4432 RepID=A0A822YYU1_NELNU|nr:TPA_asm: hypothetical protein HUJ06_007070 [Nelumbo nucifera]
MNEYSKIRVLGTTKSRSRSVDFSDLHSQPQCPKPITTHDTALISKSQKSTEINNICTNETNRLYPCSEKEHQDGVGEIFGVILRKSSSVSSTSSQRFWTEKQNTALQSAVKRAFFMRRSSSVAEGYSRIHDQCNPISSPIDDDDDNDQTTMQTRSKKKRSKLLKACKRFFGL